MKSLRKIRLVVVLLFAAVLINSACAANQTMYAVSADNTNIYEINVATGTVTIATSGSFASVGLACDGTNGYYWNSENPSHRGLAKWNMLTNTHTLINSAEISEENACFDSSGNLWILDMTNSYVDGALLGDDTRQLCKIDKSTGARTVCYTLPDVGGYGIGDIDWGPDGKLYLSTSNSTFWGYDTVDNYIWDPTVPNTIEKKAGIYHAGLAWVDGKLYGSRTVGGVGVIYELDPTDFSEIAEVANMSAYGVSIGDLSNAIPEPATITLLGLASMVLLKRRTR